MKKHKIAGELGRSTAIKKLEQAAEAIGLDLEGLVNLVADSGALALPPSDGLTEVLSLSELGAHLRAELSVLTIPEYPEWFAKLADVQKAATVVSLRNDGASTTAIASSFDISPIEANRIFNEYADKIGQQTTNVRLTTIVGHMQLVAERAQQGAMEKEDWGTYWRVQKDLISQLQSLGIVDKAIHRVEHVHTLGDAEKENLERLAQLRLKQERRKEEIKSIEAEVHDQVPEELKD